MKTIFQFIRKLLLSLFPVLVLIVMISGVVFAQSKPKDIQLVRLLDPDKTGLVNPEAIVYSSRANMFHVVEAPRNSYNASDGLVITNISVFGHNLGSTSLNIANNYPIFLAMDNQLNRLLIYQANTSQLYEVYEDINGNIDPTIVSSYDLSSIGLVNPTGMTYDPSNNYLYFLDAAYHRLVRVTNPSDGNLIDAAVDVISLGWAGSNVLQGVAFNTLSGDLYTINLSEQILYEFTGSGGVVATRDLSTLHLNSPQGIISAPSGDQTDDLNQLSIYLVDSGLLQNSLTDSVSIENNISVGNSGKIVELSMNQQSVQAVSDFTSITVKTTYTSAYDPPSPDPAGITYIGSDVPGDRRLLISDCDVEETREGITHFAGVNLWEVTLGGAVERTANISPLDPTFVPMTTEPTGVAWNPANGHYYFSDDNDHSVFDLNPGIDGVLGTADDSWSSFHTIVDNGDPEGIAYDSWHDLLYVIDGTNLEVYVYTLTGEYLNHFDVAWLGALDTESIEFNPISGTFFILSNLTSRKIYEIGVQYSDTPLLPPLELTITPTLTIDMSSVLAEDPGGIAYAPASDGSGAMHFYVVDRGEDNNNDPYENDGKLYELTAPTPTLPDNSPPVVNAGLNQDIAFGDTANLAGSVQDDGVPVDPGDMTTLWTKSSGPGTVTFGAPSSLSTTATFSAIGTYALRLTANYGEFTTYDELSVNVTSVAGSSIFEIRLLSSSDDAEENAVGNSNHVIGDVDLSSIDLELVLDEVLQNVGIRFNDVNLPKNAIINYAYVQFETRETGASSILLSINGEAQDNPSTFTDTDFNISSRPKTVSSVTWSPPAWNEVDQAGLGQRTPDIKTIIQEIIHRPGWSDGNSMVILINGTSGRRTAWSFDGLPSGAPRLHIEYTLSANHAPVANNDTYTTNEDTQLSKNPASGVLSNDNDADGDHLTAIKLTDPTHGTLNFSSNGSFTYMPDANYNGTDSFTYYCTDGLLNSNIASVNITITPVNDAPVANAQSVTTAEDTAKAITLTASDADNDPLSWIIVAGPTHGSLSGVAPALTYTPNANYFGSDSFTFKVNDGHVDSNTATVSITITSVNDAPIADSQSVSTAEDTALDITLTASDVDDTSFVWSIVSPPAHGSLSGLLPEVTYHPAQNYNGADSFTFRVNDGHVNSNNATVSITITPVNDAPIASNQSVSTNEDTAKAITLTASDSDGDLLTWAIVTPPTHGTLSGTAPAVTYTPDANYFGNDSFRFKVNDGLVDSNIATVDIMVVSVKVAPIAVADSYAVYENDLLVVDAPGVLGNDFDYDSTSLTAVFDAGPFHGELTLNPDGSFVYQPDEDYYGIDEFIYHVSDGELDSNIVAVTITIVRTKFFIYVPIIVR
jgi:VCBS repeat-containing protein